MVIANCLYFPYNLIVKNKLLAAIDLGTNTFRLLIATIAFDREKRTYSIKELHSERSITRLGDGLSRNRLLKRDAVERSLSVLARFSSIITRYDVCKTRAVATSALREARNSRDFLTKAKAAYGLAIRIISGKEEAQITASGMLLDLNIPETALMIDIGGGSTEIIFAVNGSPQIVKSLNLGVVYLAGKYMKKDPPSSDDLDQMDAEISSVIAHDANPFIRRLQKSSVLVGTAGTVTTLAAIAGRLKTFEHKKIHGQTMKRETVNRIYSDISHISSQERAKFIPFEPSRLDIIVPGTRILLKLMDTFGFREITVSNYGLREGILVDLYRRLQDEEKDCN